MNKTEHIGIKKILPSLILLAVIIVLAGLSFLPAVRGGKKTVAADREMDAEAMRMLGVVQAYAATHDFKTTLNGTIKAKVFGFPYTQNVSGTRTVSGEQFSEIAESVSTFVKAGIKREYADGKYTVSRGSYKNKKFTYGKSTELEKNAYIEAYGKPAVGIVRYELENTVISATCVGENTFRYVLDVRKATAYSRNEVKTTADSKSYPEYESVTFTLTTDGERAVKITSCEKFRIDKLGGTHCSATFTETFSYD